MSLKKSHVLAAGVAVLLAGSLATYLYFRNLAAKVSKPLGSAKIIPASALMTAFMTPNSEALDQLQELGTPEAQRLIAGGWQEIERETLAETNISYEKDLRPWVGSIAMAAIPTENSESLESVDVLFLIGIKNKIKAWNFVNKLEGNEKVKVEEKEYKGVKVWEVTEPNAQTYNSAVLGDYLAVSETFGAITEAIDTFQGEPSLASQADAAAIYSKSAGVKNPVFTLFVPDYAGLIKQLNANMSQGEQLSPSTLNSLNSVKSLVMGIGVDDAGVRMRSVSKLNAPVLENLQPIPGKLLTRFPVETIALFSGGNISQVWSYFVRQAQSDPTLSMGLDLMRQGFTANGLDVDREIFGWMDGEIVMGAIASDEGLLGQIGVGGAFLWETSDRSTAETFFNKLDAIASKSPQVSLRKAKIDGKEVTQWQVLGLGTFGGHGWLDDNTVFIAAGEPILELMATGVSDPLNRSSSFKEITGSLPQQNQGYFYLDMDRAVSWLERYPYATSYGYISPETLVVLNSIRGIGLTVVWPDDLTSEIEMVWALKSLE